MALTETRTPYDFNLVSLAKGEHKQPPHLGRQPFGQIPTIDDEGFTLFESRAICRYVSAKAHDQLIPSDIQARARMDQWLSVEQSDFSPAAMKFIYHAIFKRPQEPAVLEAATVMMEKTFQTLSGALASTDYLAGDRFSLADIGYMPYFEYALKSDARASFEKFPSVMAWWQRVSSRPAWREVIGPG